MGIPWEAIISGITLLAAIFSPAITTVINNRHTAKMQRMEYYEKHKAEVIEKYIQAAGKAIKNATDTCMQEYGEASTEVYFYIPEEYWDILDELDNRISNYDYAEARLCLREFCKCIAASNPPRLNKK